MARVTHLHLCFKCLMHYTQRDDRGSEEEGDKCMRLCLFQHKCVRLPLWFSLCTYVCSVETEKRFVCIGCIV